jgi:hypothetical protein
MAESAVSKLKKKPLYNEAYNMIHRIGRKKKRRKKT